jgi:hypothetical protein
VYIHCSKWFHQWIYYTLISQTSLLLFVTFFPYYSMTFSPLHYAFLLQWCNVFQYYSLSTILFFSPSSHYSPQSQHWNFVLHTHTFIFAYSFIFWIYLPHIRENVKTCNPFLTEPDLLCLTYDLQFHPFTCKLHNSILLYGWIKFHYIYTHIHICTYIHIYTIFSSSIHQF